MKDDMYGYAYYVPSYVKDIMYVDHHMLLTYWIWDSMYRQEIFEETRDYGLYYEL